MTTIIRDNVEQYMNDLRTWLRDTTDTKLEDMDGFFRARLEGYEQHMLSNWSEAYVRLAEMVPPDTRSLLDLGCGTGLEIDEIVKKLCDVEITGVDLSDAMLDRLRSKYPGVNTVCADYFEHDFACGCYDAAVSFESLHHFKPNKKRELYQKIYRALKGGGVFILADYIACCDEEERLLMEQCDRKRRAEGIADDVFVHFDTPLTAEHEILLMLEAGFDSAELVCAVDGVAFIVAGKSG